MSLLSEACGVHGGTGRRRYRRRQGTRFRRGRRARRRCGSRCSILDLVDCEISKCEECLAGGAPSQLRHPRCLGVWDPEQDGAGRGGGDHRCGGKSDCDCRLLMDLIVYRRGWGDTVRAALCSLVGRLKGETDRLSLRAMTCAIDLALFGLTREIDRLASFHDRCLNSTCSLPSIPVFLSAAMVKVSLPSLLSLLLPHTQRHCTATDRTDATKADMDLTAAVCTTRRSASSTRQ